MNNPRFIRTAIEVVETAIKENSPALLGACTPARKPFASYGRAFAGVMPNPPSVLVEPMRTQLGGEGNYLDQQDVVTVLIGLVAGSPEELQDAMLDYVAAVTIAILAARLDAAGTVTRVWPEVQDYGPLYKTGGGFGRFAEVHVVADRAEVL